MPIWSLTRERIDKLLKQVGDKELEIDTLIKLTKEDLWTKDLDEFLAEWRFQLDDEAKRQKVRYIRFQIPRDHYLYKGSQDL